jgi:hypothetical protein
LRIVDAHGLRGLVISLCCSPAWSASEGQQSPASIQPMPMATAATATAAIATAAIATVTDQRTAVATVTVAWGSSNPGRRCCGHQRAVVAPRDEPPIAVGGDGDAVWHRAIG